MCGCAAFIVRYDMLLYSLNKCLLLHSLFEVQVCVGSTLYFVRGVDLCRVYVNPYSRSKSVWSTPFFFRGADLCRDHSISKVIVKTK